MPTYWPDEFRRTVRALIEFGVHRPWRRGFVVVREVWGWIPAATYGMERGQIWMPRVAAFGTRGTSPTPPQV
ncbi:hypothetical protein ACFP2T_31440, partial [Plantactinospora solaniradicis]